MHNAPVPRSPLFGDRYSPGRVAAAFFLKPGTLRSWHASPLELASEPPEPNGRRRYSFADAALVALVASLTDLYNGNPGMSAARAIGLANVARNAIRDFAGRFDGFEALNAASPVIVAWGDRGDRNGWRVHAFASIKDLAEALAATDPTMRASLDTMTIDVVALFTRTATALTRPGLAEEPGE
jgi:hypothetical protein